MEQINDLQQQIQDLQNQVLELQKNQIVLSASPELQLNLKTLLIKMGFTYP